MTSAEAAADCLTSVFRYVGYCHPDRKEWFQKNREVVSDEQRKAMTRKIEERTVLRTAEAKSVRDTLEASDWLGSDLSLNTGDSLTYDSLILEWFKPWPVVIAINRSGQSIEDKRLKSMPQGLDCEDLTSEHDKQRHKMELRRPRAEQDSLAQRIEETITRLAEL